MELVFFEPGDEHWHGTAPTRFMRLTGRTMRLTGRRAGTVTRRR